MTFGQSAALRNDHLFPAMWYYNANLPLSVANYTQLRGVVAASITMVYVSGILGTIQPSGIAGFFERDNSDTTSADNNGTIIVAGTGAGQVRWKRVFSGELNAKWFEVVMDGVTADTVNFQKFITAMGANGRGYIPAGIMFLNGTITGLANQTLRGAGANTTMLYRTGDYGDTMVFGSAVSSCGHVCIENIWFKHGSGDYVPGVNSVPNKATSGAHIRLWDSQESIIRNVWVWRLTYGIVYEGGSYGALEYCNFYGVWDPLFAAAQEGIGQVLYRKSTAGGIPTSMRIKTCQLTGAAALSRATNFAPSTGVVSRNITALVGSQYGVIINCMEDFQMDGGCYSSGHSQNTILISNVATDPVLELRILGNFLDCAGNYIIQVSPAVGANAAYISVVGNTSNGEDTGLGFINFSQVGATFGCHSSVVSDNTVLAFIATPILAAGLAKSAIVDNNISSYNSLNVTPTDLSWCSAVYVTGASRDLKLDDNVVGYGTYTYNGIEILAGLTNVTQNGNKNAGAVTFAAQTPMIGNLTIGMKRVTGNTNAAQGASVSVAHGLTPAKILSIQALVFHTATQAVADGFTFAAGYEFNASLNVGNIDVSNKAANSANILNKAFVILITYDAT